MIHKSGTVATFWQTSLVTARNMTEARAGRPIQAARSSQLGAASAEVARPAGLCDASAAWNCRARKVHQAQNAQHTPNTTKPIDHMAACWRESQWTSKKNG